jgi:hypothetical protein
MPDATARDQLARICSLIMNGHYDDPDDDAYALAEEIIGRGWRPPARTVSTVEGLEGFPERAVISDASGGVAVCLGNRYSNVAGNVWGVEGGAWLLSRGVPLPAVVLREAVIA